MRMVTDSAADLLPQEVDTLGITVAPLKIQFPDGEVSSEQISPDEFYTRLREMAPEVPTTSQPSSGVFASIYRNLAQTRDEIFSIHISSGLSGTIESARMGAHQESESDVTLIDSLTLSGGERFQVLAAIWGAKAGLGKQVILDRLNKMRAATEVIFTLDTLSYLAKGGRIGRVQALAGALLKIKPVIAVDKQDGRYNLVGRARTLRQALETVVEQQSKIFGSHTPVWVSIMHGQFQEQAENLSKLMNERMQVAKIEVLRISPVLGVHTGPGVVGAAVVPMELMDWLP